MEKKISIRASEADYNVLLQIKEETRIPIAQLVHIAVPYLKKKYNIKDEDNGRLHETD